jgi:hypothetical protein
MAHSDWVAWHDFYDDPSSAQSRRLAIVQDQIREVLEQQSPGPIRVIVPCAGQGRDLLGALVDHPRRCDVVATLVDLEPGNVAAARTMVNELALPGITAIAGDAGRTTIYREAVPASVVVLSGFFAYLSKRHASKLIATLPQLCARDATVIWSRQVDPQGRRVPFTRKRFEASGFRPVPSTIPNTGEWHVGVERFVGTPIPLSEDQHIFSFRESRSALPARVRRYLAVRKRQLTDLGRRSSKRA